MTEEEFADLVALCQFLPGPTSSQVGFAIGLRQAGLVGGLAAFVGFTTPSALLMFGTASGLFAVSGDGGMAFIHGLMLVAASIVAYALYGMAKSLCPDRFTAFLAVAAITVLFMTQAAWVQPVVILAAGAVGMIGGAHTLKAPHPEATSGNRRLGFVSFGLFAVLLIGLPLLAARSGEPVAMLMDAFYRSGALVFGGGHVVLPLLESETVGRQWLDQSTFLAGYGAAQALPGPLFAFAAFLGATSSISPSPIIGGTVALVAIFLPGLLLVSGALTIWSDLKQNRRTVGFVRGANAAVVGVLAAAFYHPIITSAILRPLDVAIVVAGFVAQQMFRAPPWSVVILLAIAGAVSQAMA